MYVRIARFEGMEGNIDDTIERVREQMRDGKANRSDQVPMTRAMMLVDRDGGRGANVIFCDTEEDLRRVDAFMNSMQGHGGGSRSSVEMYEVAVDSDDL